MMFLKVRDGIAKVAAAGLGLPEIAILLEIAVTVEARKSPPTIGALQKQLKMPFSSVSRQTWGLFEGGFVDFGKTHDRRERPVLLTKKGQALVQLFSA